MTKSRLLVLGGLLTAAGAAGVATLMATGSPLPHPAPQAGVAPAAKAAAPATTEALAAKPDQDPRCADQDKDDDAAERREKRAGKPDNDDVELQCGDQNDDDNEVEDRDDRKEHKAPEVRKAPGAAAPQGAASKRR